MLLLMEFRVRFILFISIILSGCAMPASHFKDLNPSNVHYRIFASVPEGHTLEASTIYKPVNGECPEHSEAFDWELSRKRVELHREKSGSKNEYMFKIPMNILVMGCQLNAASSHLTLKLNYGYGSTQDTEDLYFISEQERREAKVQDEQLGSLNQVRLCSHEFYVTRLGSHLKKSLSCATSDNGRVHSPIFAFEELGGETITYLFSKGGEDEPRSPRSWVRTAAGYRPCVGGDYNSFCKDPPEFKRFKMGERQCDIYPGCSLQDQP